MSAAGCFGVVAGLHDRALWLGFQLPSCQAARLQYFLLLKQLLPGKLRRQLYKPVRPFLIATWMISDLRLIVASNLLMLVI